MSLKFTERNERAARISAICNGGTKFCEASRVVELLEAALRPRDRVVIEGNNQKQADFLARALTKVNRDQVNGLHIVQPVLALPEHLSVFERGVAERVDFSFSGPTGKELARLVAGGAVRVGAIHTYLELYARMVVDLRPQVALVVAEKADRAGNLYTGPNTEDTPFLVEATAFNGGLVIAQVNEIVETLPRVDIPGDWLAAVVQSEEPYHIEPLFTRDPGKIRNDTIRMAMMAIVGIYERYQVQRSNHGIGYATAAIELLLPTFATARGLKGKVAKHFVLNPHPTLIPAIERGFVESVYCFGSELGMEAYTSANEQVFSIGPDGSLRSNRAYAQMAGHYACDAFIGSTLQMDARGNSSTALSDRITGFGGAPNMGADARGRRHASQAWLAAGREAGELMRGRKLVVQMLETTQADGTPNFVDELDAIGLAQRSGFELPPIMIYGDDVTHVISEKGIANLLLCRSPSGRELALRSIAGDTPFGRMVASETVDRLRAQKIVQYPIDLGLDRISASRDLLAAQSIEDLVAWSKGLYVPPARFALSAQH